MEKQVKGLLQDYQKLISMMDKKLAVYEQLGSPEEIAAKLKVQLQPVAESNLANIQVKKSTPLLERRKKIAESFEVNKEKEIEEVISKIPVNNVSNIVQDVKFLLSKFEL